MQVFKVIIKTIRKNFHVLSIYLIVFVGFMVLMSSVQSSGGSSMFSEVKRTVMIINHDSGNVIADEFADFMKRASIPIDPVETEEEMLDALFNEEADYILIIPEGFSADFLSGSYSNALEQQSIAGSRSAVWTDMKIRKYMDLLRLYTRLSDVDVNDSEAIRALTEKVEKQMNTETVVIYPVGVKKQGNEFTAMYFKFMGYSLMAVTILGIGFILKIFNGRDFRNRLRCSPEKTSNVNIQLVIGSLCFAAVAWLVLILIAITFSYFEGIKPWIWLTVVNSFVFMLSTLCMSVVLGLVVKGENARSAVANVVALGSSFLGGIFVPQEFQSEIVRKIAGFLPAFWFVKAIDEIQGLSSFTWNNIRPIMMYMLIQLIFGVAFICVAMAVSRERSRRTV